MLKVAAMLKGKTIHPAVSLSVSPGSRQVLTMLGRLRRPVGHPRQRRAGAGMRLRPLHRHGLLAKLRRRFPAGPSTGTSRAAPEHGRRAGVSGFPRNRRGLGPDGVHHRPDAPLASRLHVTMPESFLDERHRRAAACSPRTRRRTPKCFAAPTSSHSPRASPLPTA